MDLKEAKLWDNFIKKLKAAVELVYQLSATAQSQAIAELELRLEALQGHCYRNNYIEAESPEEFPAKEIESSDEPIEEKEIEDNETAEKEDRPSRKRRRKAPLRYCDASVATEDGESGDHTVALTAEVKLEKCDDNGEEVVVAAAEEDFGDGGGYTVGADGDDGGGEGDTGKEDEALTQVELESILEEINQGEREEEDPPFDPNGIEQEQEDEEEQEPQKKKVKVEGNKQKKRIVKGEFLQCEICDFSVRSPETFRRHHLRKHKTETQCGQCQLKFTVYHKYMTHYYKDHKQASYQCDDCGQVFYFPVELRRHIASIHTNPDTWDHLCSDCGQAFPTKSRLLAHMNKHVTDDKKMYMCDQCDYRTSMEYVLKKHKENIHNPDKEPYTCPICGRQLKYAESLRVHMRRHKGERPFQCDQCPAAFPSPSELRGHERIHATSKPHACPTCPYRCITKAGLRLHEATHADKGGDGNNARHRFVCRWCSYGASTRPNLRKHCLRRHGEEWPPKRGNGVLDGVGLMERRKDGGEEEAAAKVWVPKRSHSSEKEDPSVTSGLIEARKNEGQHIEEGITAQIWVPNGSNDLEEVNITRQLVPRIHDNNDEGVSAEVLLPKISNTHTIETHAIESNENQEDVVIKVWRPQPHKDPEKDIQELNDNKEHANSKQEDEIETSDGNIVTNKTMKLEDRSERNETKHKQCNETVFNLFDDIIEQNQTETERENEDSKNIETIPNQESNVDDKYDKGENESMKVLRMRGKTYSRVKKERMAQLQDVVAVSDKLHVKDSAMMSSTKGEALVLKVGEKVTGVSSQKGEGRNSEKMSAREVLVEREGRKDELEKSEEILVLRQGGGAVLREDVEKSNFEKKLSMESIVTEKESVDIKKLSDVIQSDKCSLVASTQGLNDVKLGVELSESVEHIDYYATFDGSISNEKCVPVSNEKEAVDGSGVVSESSGMVRYKDEDEVANTSDKSVIVDDSDKAELQVIKEYHENKVCSDLEGGNDGNARQGAISKIVQTQAHNDDEICEMLDTKLVKVVEIKEQDIEAAMKQVDRDGMDEAEMDENVDDMQNSSIEESLDEVLMPSDNVEVSLLERKPTVITEEESCSADGTKSLESLADLPTGKFIVDPTGKMLYMMESDSTEKFENLASGNLNFETEIEDLNNGKEGDDIKLQETGYSQSVDAKIELETKEEIDQSEMVLQTEGQVEDVTNPVIGSEQSLTEFQLPVSFADVTSDFMASNPFDGSFSDSSYLHPSVVSSSENPIMSVSSSSPSQSGLKNLHVGSPMKQPSIMLLVNPLTGSPMKLMPNPKSQPMVPQVNYQSTRFVSQSASAQNLGRNIYTPSRFQSPHVSQIPPSRLQGIPKTLPTPVVKTMPRNIAGTSQIVTTSDLIQGPPARKQSRSSKLRQNVQSFVPPTFATVSSLGTTKEAKKYKSSPLVTTHVSKASNSNKQFYLVIGNLPNKGIPVSTATGRSNTVPRTVQSTQYSSYGAGPSFLQLGDLQLPASSSIATSGAENLGEVRPAQATVTKSTTLDIQLESVLDDTCMSTVDVQNTEESVLSEQPKKSVPTTISTSLFSSMDMLDNTLQPSVPASTANLGNDDYVYVSGLEPQDYMEEVLITETEQEKTVASFTTKDTESFTVAEKSAAASRGGQKRPPGGSNLLTSLLTQSQGAEGQDEATLRYMQMLREVTARAGGAGVTEGQVREETDSDSESSDEEEDDDDSDENDDTF